jgi:hypothetical protein
VSGIWISCEEKDKRKKNPHSEVGINVKEEGFHPKYLAVPNTERSKRIDEQPGRDFVILKPCATTCLLIFTRETGGFTVQEVADFVTFGGLPTSSFIARVLGRGTT